MLRCGSGGRDVGSAEQARPTRPDLGSWLLPASSHTSRGWGGRGRRRGRACVRGAGELPPEGPVHPTPSRAGRKGRLGFRVRTRPPGPLSRFPVRLPGRVFCFPETL